MPIDDEAVVVGDLQDFQLDLLHYQYIPYVTPFQEIWRCDMSLSNSPHVELLRAIEEHGLNWKVLWQTRYVAERVRRRRVLKWRKWTDSYIRNHIKTRWNTYLSLKANGLDPRLYKDDSPVKILQVPLWQSRFGIVTPGIHGMEIFDGGGRCAAAYALGWKAIKAVPIVDRLPGTCERGYLGVKLRSISKEVWGQPATGCGAPSRTDDNPSPSFRLWDWLRRRVPL
jgi:hypothetical protein